MRAGAISTRFALGSALPAALSACLLVALAVLVVPVGLLSCSAARADALDDAQVLREGGCGGLLPARGPLRHLDRLDRAAALWAGGGSLSEAARRAGIMGEHLAGIHVTGSDDAVLQRLRDTECGMLMNRALTEAGVYEHGRSAWLLLASTYVMPRATRSPRHAPLPRTAGSLAFATRVLALVNAVRTRGTSCGRRAFRPTTPVRLSARLQQIAAGHAHDMAEHGYFEHQDLTGRTPADRVRAAGYREQLVGENIAFGPQSADEVVRGWLHSTGHCENIMDPRFAEMGIAYAFGAAPQGATGTGLYWVQDLVDPR
jgi:uncharacterized protein YkwD